MKKEKFLIPEFGPFAGMRVIGTGSLIAMPFAASMLAEFGAEVIQIERPGQGDTYRHFPPVVRKGDAVVSSSFIQDARNRLSMTLELNLKNSDAKDIFFGLIKQADVYIENMVWLDKLGIRDEELLAVNPKLIIVHISGYGHIEFGGVPEICNQASYDMIGQAFSGFVRLNGYPDRPPLIIKPSLNDYVTAMFAVFGVLAAYLGTQKTGKGQIVDVAQFEAQAKLMRDTFTRHSLGLGDAQLCGSAAVGFQPWDLFISSDNIYVALGAVGPSVFYRLIDAVGLDREKYSHDVVSKDAVTVSSPRGREFAGMVTDWCRSHTASEIEDTMCAHKVPCSRVNTPADCMANDQYRLRDDFITYQDQTLMQDVTAFGVVPKLSGTPGMVWRGAPSLGQDTDRILKELLGYDDEKISALRYNKII